MTSIPIHSIVNASPSILPPSDQEVLTVPDSCASVLVQRCLACFAGNIFGRPLQGGGDIHIATDGNFHHCHRRSAGSCPPFYDPIYFIPKAQVDEVGHWIQQARKRVLKQWHAVVLDEAIDQCEASYDAADGNKQKATMECFDDTGIMALICCHDIPLFFANIDTPSEQQKFSVALIEHLFTFLPPSATVVVLYDVRCILARSLEKVRQIIALILTSTDIRKFDILHDDIVRRIRFATTAMHAYGYEWACQLSYNP